MLQEIRRIGQGIASRQRSRPAGRGAPATGRGRHRALSAEPGGERAEVHRAGLGRAAAVAAIRSAPDRRSAAAATRRRSLLVDLEALALQVQALARESEGPSRVFDVAVHPQRVLDERAFDVLDGGVERLIAPHEQLRGRRRPLSYGHRAP